MHAIEREEKGIEVGEKGGRGHRGGWEGRIEEEGLEVNRKGGGGHRGK